MLPTSDIIPRHATAMVGCNNSHTGRYYVLLKDEHLLVVQATPCYDRFATDDPAAWKYLTMEHEYGIEIIQSLLNVVEFGRSNWAYLVSQGGTYRLVYKDVPMRHMKCPTWAPFVDECDVQITQWVTGERRHGIWKGKEVDLLVAWGDEHAIMIENNTRGHRILLGLDLSFEVLGHIVRDGQVVGLMTEPAYGRLVEYQDRALVYEAIAKLQRRGILYRECQHAPNIMISEGKVRFLQTTHMINLPTIELAKEAEYWHWKTLDVSFEELRKRPNIYSAACHRNVPYCVQIIPNLPLPQRSLTPKCILFTLEVTSGRTNPTGELGTVDMRRPRRPIQKNTHRLLLSTSDSPNHGYHKSLKSDNGDDDTPLELVLTIPSRRRPTIHNFHPYDRVFRAKRNPARFEVLDATSSTSGISSLE
jgi:hypothetical protein